MVYARPVRRVLLFFVLSAGTEPIFRMILKNNFSRASKIQTRCWARSRAVGVVRDTPPPWTGQTHSTPCRARNARRNRLQ
jgi:hypothetical protein